MRRPSKSTCTRSVSISSQGSRVSTARRSDISSGLPMLITKAPVLRHSAELITVRDVERENEYLRLTFQKLMTAFQSVKTQHQQTREQIKRLLDIYDYFSISPPVTRAEESQMQVPAVLPSSSQSLENTTLKLSVWKLERVLTDLRLKLHRKKQEYQLLRLGLVKVAMEQLTSYLPLGFCAQSVSFSELVSLYIRVGYRCSGLSARDREKIPIVAVGDTQAEEMCCICLSHFEVGKEAKRLPRCSHTFHSQCIDEWLQLRRSCPLCVGDVVV